MKLTYDNLSNLLLKELSESTLLASIKTLQLGFTSEREKLSHYLSSEELVSAYTLFYLPTNFPKFSFLMNQLDSVVLKRISSNTFIDLGTGPGTFICAFIEYFKELERPKIIGVDQSPVMLAQAKKCIDNFESLQSLHLLENIPRLQENEECTLCLGHSLNEMGAKKALKIIDQLSPKDILFFEPGTPASFIELLNMKNLLKNIGYVNCYPCPDSVGSCSMTTNKNWCHQILRTTHDPSIERISQKAKLDRRSMPLIAHHYSKEMPESDLKSRLIRIIRETKHSYELEVCQKANELIIIEIRKKDLSKDNKKRLKNLSLGCECKYMLLERRNQKWSAKLTSF